MSTPIERPGTDEYNPYYGNYIELVTQPDVLTELGSQPGLLKDLLKNTSETGAGFRPGPKEWSIKEVVGHLIDAERVFAYRAFCFARGEKQPLPGFEQDEYVREGHYDARSLADLLDEFSLLRQANILYIRALSPEATSTRGTASGSPISVRALIYIMAGHVSWHVKSLKEVYLK